MDDDPVVIVDDATPPRALLAVSTFEQLEVLSTHVERAGWEVDAAERGIELIERVPAEEVDLAVIDLPLLGSLGFRLLEVLRVVRPECLLVLIDTLGSSRETALEAGADGVIDGRDVSDLLRLLREGRRSSVSTNH